MKDDELWIEQGSSKIDIRAMNIKQSKSVQDIMQHTNLCILLQQLKESEDPNAALEMKVSRRLFVALSRFETEDVQHALNNDLIFTERTFNGEEHTRDIPQVWCYEKRAPVGKWSFITDSPSWVTILRYLGRFFILAMFLGVIVAFVVASNNVSSFVSGVGLICGFFCCIILCIIYESFVLKKTLFQKKIVPELFDALPLLDFVDAISFNHP